MKTISRNHRVGAMKNLLVAGLAMLFAISAAQSVSAAIFVTNLVDGINTLPIPGNQAWGGQLGDDFTTNNAIKITKIGVFDDDGDGTSGDLTWQLFNVTTGNLIHTEIVDPTGTRSPAGSAIEDNYVWKTLSTPLYLNANAVYSAVAYGFDSADKNFNTNFGLNTLDVVFTTDSLTAHGGRFSYSSEGYLNLPTHYSVGNGPSTEPYNFGAASFVFEPVPEPASCITFAGLALCLGAAGWRSRRKKLA